MWSSFFNRNSPLEANIIYPFVATITQISSNNASMEAGGYGWSLDSLVTNGLINHYDEPLIEEITQVEFEETESTPEEDLEVNENENEEEILHN